MARVNGGPGSAGVGRAVSVRGAWQLAGLLFIAGALTTIPASFLLDPVETWKYGFTTLGVVTGALCLLLPWQRVDDRWLALVPVVAIAEIAIAVGITHPVFSYLYFFVALYVGLVFPHPQQLAPYLALTVLALLTPLAYETEPVREVLLWALAITPGVALTAIVVGRLTSGLEQSREAYRRLSGEDGLTGVGNYRSMMERLAQETARHGRRRREFALLTLDMDNFKQVNETQGHLVGDLLLATVGSTLDLKVRTEDMVFRQGGDEFSVVAPETGRDQAILLAERLEQALSQISSGEMGLSATVGWAVFPEDGGDPGQLLDAADTNLIARKRRGQLAQR